MKEIDPGHYYQLHILDGPAPLLEPNGCLIFVKREGEKYPGNVGHYPGTLLQECWRAEIARLKYLNQQEWHETNDEAIEALRSCIYGLEKRAAERHGTQLVIKDPRNFEIENLPICLTCGHIFPHTH